MKIGALNIAEVEQEAFFSLLPLASPHKQPRIKAFMFDKDKQRCLFADLLARIMLAEFIDAPVKFSILPSGKPVLDGVQGVHFNVSHSGDWVVCVVDDNEVGIDVEEITEIDLSISDRFFCWEEHADILHAASSTNKFFEYWTLKESYIKFIGEGLSKPLNAFRVEFLPGQIRVGDAYLKQYEIGKGYKMAVCAGHEEFPEWFKVYGIEEFRELTSSTPQTLP